MNAALGHDFTHVRIHTDGEADRAAEQVSARAFTIGAHIWFKQGLYAPGSKAGDELLMHELVHVQQHDEGRLPGALNGKVSKPTDAHEKEASRISREGAARASDPKPVSPDMRRFSAPSPVGTLNRLADDPPVSREDSPTPVVQEDVVRRRFRVNLTQTVRTDTDLLEAFAAQIALTYPQLAGTQWYWIRGEGTRADAGITPSVEDRRKGYIIVPFRVTRELMPENEREKPNGASPVNMLSPRARELVQSLGVPVADDPTIAEQIQRVGEQLASMSQDQVRAFSETLQTPDVRALIAQSSNPWQVIETHLNTFSATQPAWDPRIENIGFVVNADDSTTTLLNVVRDSQLSQADWRYARDWISSHILPSHEQHPATGLLEVTQSSVEVMRQIDQSPDKARILEILSQSRGGAEEARSTSLTEVLATALNEVRLDQERSRLGIELDEQDPDPRRRRYPFPVEGEIVYSELLYPGRTGAFSFRHSGRHSAIGIPYVHVQWVVKRSSSTDAAGTGTEDATDDVDTVRGSTYHRALLGDPPEAFETTFEHAGIYEINAYVDHSYYLPSTFSVLVEVKEKSERVAELEAQAFGQDGQGPFGSVDRCESHDFESARSLLGGLNPATMYIDGVLSRGAYCEGTMEGGGASLNREERLRLVTNRLTELRQLQGSGMLPRAQADMLRDQIDRLEQLERTIRAEEDAGFQVLMARGSYLADTSEARTRSDMAITASAARSGTSGQWTVRVRDATFELDDQISNFEATAADFRGAIEGCFVDLCKSYPQGVMSVRVEEPDGRGGSTGRWIGFQLDCGSVGEYLRRAVYNPGVQVAVNLVGLMAMLAFPPSSVFVTPALMVYNQTNNMLELSDRVTRGVAEGGDYTRAWVDLGVDLIPYLGQVSKVVKVGTTTFKVVLVAEAAGGVILVAENTYQQIAAMRSGILQQAAQTHAQVLWLQQNRPSDPSLDGLRATLLRQIGEAEEGWKDVVVPAVLQQTILMAAPTVGRQILARAPRLRAHTNTPLVRADPAQVHPDTPQVHPDTPQVHPDTPQVHPDTPQVHPDAAQVHPDTPQGRPDTSTRSTGDGQLVLVDPRWQNTEQHRQLRAMRGSDLDTLAQRPRGWTGEEEAKFRWGPITGCIPNTHCWTLDHNNKPTVRRRAVFDSNGNEVPRRIFTNESGFSPRTESLDGDQVDLVFPEVKDGRMVVRATRTRAPQDHQASSTTQRAMEGDLTQRAEAQRREATAHQDVLDRCDALGIAEDDVSSENRDKTLRALRGRYAQEPQRLEQVEALEQALELKSKSHGEVNRQSMLIGLRMADDWARRTFPDARLVYGDVSASSTPRPGDFDLVYVRGGGDQPEQVIIVEAKGGSGALGTRRVRGVPHEQGTERYMREIARLMADSEGGDRELRRLMRRLRDGEVEVRYFLVRAPIGTAEGQPRVNPGQVSEFELGDAP